MSKAIIIIIIISSSSSSSTFSLHKVFLSWLQAAVVSVGSVSLTNELFNV